MAALFGDGPPVSKAIGGIGAAKSAADLAGYGGGAAGSAAGGAVAAAGLGYGLSQIAGSDLSTKRKMAESSKAGADTIMSLTIPYYGLAKGVQAIGQQLQKSGSPQVRAAGTSLDYAAEPGGAKAFWSSALGRDSLKDSLMKEGRTGLLMDLMGPFGVAFRAAGIDDNVSKIMDPIGSALEGLLGHTPTHGTQFRHAFDQVLGKIPAFSDWQGSQDRDGRRLYEMDPATYEAFTPEARSAATTLGQQLAALTGDVGKDPAYAIQAGALLLNQYGNGLAERLARLQAAASQAPH